MPYNYTEAFLRGGLICPDCKNALAVAAVVAFQSEFQEKIKKLVVDIGRKTVIVVSVNQTRVYTWDELSFIACQCGA